MTASTAAPPQPAYVPLGAAAELFRLRAPEVVIAGPAGTGKSRACLQKLMVAADKYRGCRILIARKTRESLTQSALVTWEKKVLPQGWERRITFHHEDQEYRFPGGSVVVLGGLDKPSKIMSTEFDLIYVQECRELGQEDWESLLSRLRHGAMPYQQIIGDTNPDAPEHWIKLRERDGHILILESRHEDNPTVTLDYLAKLDSLTGYQYQRLRLGLWVAAEGMFFTEWNPEVHICEPFDIPAEWTRWTATDYGFADPFCTLWFARSPDSKHTYVYRELYATGLRDEQQAKLIKERSSNERIVRYVGDPSMFNMRTEQDKPSIATVYEANGVRLERGVNDRRSGWQTVRRALACEDSPPRLQVFRGRCPNLIRTLPAMVHDPLDAEDLADKIKSQKTEDHGVDALRYGLVAEQQVNQTQALAEWAKAPVRVHIDAGGERKPKVDQKDWEGMRVA
ncbi:MAG: terminase [Actinobacteria bacterium]|nr:terminase [Actinomycetota bacterium]